MKLAEALLKRKELLDRINQLRSRAVASTTVTEGDEPVDQPNELLAETEKVADELGRLIVAINQTNNVVTIGTGQTISEAIATRDMLNLVRTSYDQVANTAINSTNRNTYHHLAEEKVVATVKPKEVRSKVDELAKQHRQLDTLIQAANWQYDLIES